MNRTIEAKGNRDLTEQELNAVTGGMVRQPNNINKPPLFTPVPLSSKA